MGGEASDILWTAARRMEAWAGELRVNLFRLVAIAAFYGHHLVNAFILKAELPPGYHLTVTGIAVAWTAAALVLHSGLLRRWNPPWLAHAAVAFDALMITTLLVLRDGPRSPLVLLLFLLVATAPLRLDLRLVWVAALLAIFSYAFACGHAKWKKPEWRVPRREQVILVIGLGCAGLLAGQAVRQSRRFARDFADRVRPETPP